MSNQNNKKEFENMFKPYVTTEDSALILSQGGKTVPMWKPGSAEMSLYHDGAYHCTYGANALWIDVCAEYVRLEQRTAAAGARQVC